MAGWKEWAIGEVVEAGDIQGFIQNQTVMVFDTDTARDTALSGVVIEGMMAYTKDSDSVKVYDGAAWIGLAEAPDLSTLIPKSTVTTAGDLIVADGASSVTRLGVGADDQILTLASGLPVWADAAGGGGMTVIASGSNSGLLNIFSIPQTYKHLQLVFIDLSFTSDSELYIRLNNDSGNNYVWSASPITGGPSNSAASNYIRITAEPIYNSGNGADSVINIFNYAQTSGYVPVTAVTVGQKPFTPMFADFCQAGYDRSAAITSIQTTSASANTGTYILYGVN
jgi:hypothetical protein